VIVQNLIDVGTLIKRLAPATDCIIGVRLHQAMRTGLYFACAVAAERHARPQTTPAVVAPDDFAHDQIAGTLSAIPADACERVTNRSLCPVFVVDVVVPSFTVIVLM